MKTILFTICILSAALCESRAANLTVDATADSVLLSTRTEGSYEVATYKVSGDVDKADYSLYYPIAKAVVERSFANNAQHLAALDTFVAKISSDKMMNVGKVMITGYASPDGAVAANRTLASSRAAALRNYIVQRYGKKAPALNIQTATRVVTWSECAERVRSSSIPNRAEVLAVMLGNDSEQSKEQQLKAMVPSVWEYLKTEILPQMRCAEVVFAFSQSQTVEHRTEIKSAAPTPTPANAPTAAPAASKTQPSTTAAPAKTAQTQSQPEIVESEAVGIVIIVPDETEKE